MTKNIFALQVLKRTTIVSNDMLKMDVHLAACITHHLLRNPIPCLAQRGLERIHSAVQFSTSLGLKDGLHGIVHNIQIRAWQGPDDFRPEVRKCCFAPLLDNFGTIGWGTVLLEGEISALVVLLQPWDHVIENVKICVLVDLDILGHDNEGLFFPSVMTPAQTITEADCSILGVVEGLNCENLLICEENWALCVGVKAVEEGALTFSFILALWPQKAAGGKLFWKEPSWALFWWSSTWSFCQPAPLWPSSRCCKWGSSNFLPWHTWSFLPSSEIEVDHFLGGHQQSRSLCSTWQYCTPACRSH